MLPQLSVRRRQRADSDEERCTPSSSSGKRQRANNDNGHCLPQRDAINSSNPDGDQYQPGAIIRVSLIDFVTYEKADFYPGPSLNMVIGPNGTGKSSLVSAICLGLGYSPSHLGRAEDFKSYVRTGKKTATIEIELKGNPNHIVRVLITKADNKRKWWINGRDATLRNVQELMKELNIQIDNLCQFLPQDRVNEFANMSPKEKLLNMQRAAAPPEMLEKHNQLIELRRKQKDLLLKYETSIADLQANQTKKGALQDDVDKLQDRAEAEQRKDRLEKCKVYIEYQTRRTEFKELSTQRKKAIRDKTQLEARVRPTLDAIAEKEEYQQQIEAAKKQRARSVQQAEHALGGIAKEIKGVEERITELEKSKEAENKMIKTKNVSIQSRQTKIKELNAKLTRSVDFDAQDWNRRIKDQNDKTKTLKRQLGELEEQDARAQAEARPIRRDMDRLKNEVAAMDSQAGRASNRLKEQSQDTAAAWEWIQRNQDKFERPIYGPPLIECRIKDGYDRFLDAVESFVSKEAFLSFTTQTRADYQKLISELRNQGLSDFYVKNSNKHITEYRPPMDDEQIRQYALDGFAIDFVDGPDPVLAMLCGTVQLHSSGIAVREHTSAQHGLLTSAACPIRRWVARGQSFRVVRRTEYGPDAVSSNSGAVGKAQYLTEQPVDNFAKQELARRLEELTTQYEEMKVNVSGIRKSVADLRMKIKDCESIAQELQSQKNELQREYSNQQGIPAQIETHEERIVVHLQEIQAIRGTLTNFYIEKANAMLEKADFAFRFKDYLARLRTTHDELLEAEVWLLEATSDVETLKIRNEEIRLQLHEAEVTAKQASKDCEVAKERAKRLLVLIERFRSGFDEAEEEIVSDMAQQYNTEDKIDAQIAAEEAFLESNFTSNPNAKKEYDKYQANIAKLEQSIGESTGKLEKYAAEITTVKAAWEPALDDLVSKISEAFSYNFQQIGCAGEVSVHKDDDFDDWTLEIKVRFREGESLQALDSHRQSGGERSVSTGFFLMSLQSMARAPFRVVDEINQGMDPRNERTVHERMVDIACKEHTSQYFLITPKLLTNLRYHPRMRVLCIASGEYMPKDHTMVSVSKAIAIKRALLAAS